MNPSSRDFQRIANILLASTLVLLQTGYANGEQTRMNAKSIKQNIVGNTFEGFYTFDGIRFVETYEGNGTLDYRDEREALSGWWTIENDLFCNRYPDPVGGCFALYRESANCIVSYSAPSEGIPYTPPAGASPGVRMWDVSKPSTCPGQQPMS